MKLSTKIIIFASAALLLAAFVFLLVRQQEILSRQKQIESSIVLQKELADKILRSQAEYATRKDVEDFLNKQNVAFAQIKSDMDKLGATLSAVNVVVAKSNGQVSTNVSSTRKEPSDMGTPTVNCNGKEVSCPDPNGYMATTQYLKLNESFAELKVPFGEVGFSFNKDKPWQTNILPRQYHVTTVIGKDEEGRDYAYNKFQIEVDGKKYEVKIDQAKLVQVYPESKFSWWNPRLYLGVNGGVNFQQSNADASPSLSVSFMSYGKTKTQPSFTVLGVGAGYFMNNQKVNVMVTPVTYNVGQHIPLMRNLYLGPSVAFDTAGGVYGLATLQVGL